MTAPSDRPARLGPYLLQECIGCGGMAAVYKAQRRDGHGHGTMREVVVKTLLPQHARNPRVLRLFADETRLSTQLDHRNIVRAHRSGFAAGKPFLELEYLSGWNLQQLMEAVRARGGTLPVPIALTLGTEICRGLAYVHSFVDEAGVPRPIIYRDVSPANVMIGRDGSVKLLDFGSARVTRGETLSIDTFMGKLAYMSPEQLERRQLDRRADVFALGALLHELLVGRPLFAGADDAETLRRVQRLAIDPPSRHNAAVPAELDVIVLRALSRDPERRPATAMELLAALERLEAVAAPHEELLRYLGALAPDVFKGTCEECGRVIPLGSACPRCKTEVYVVALPPPRAPPIPHTPPGRLRLRFYLIAAHLHHIIAALAVAVHDPLAWLRAWRLRIVVAAEQIALLLECAWPRQPRPLLGDDGRQSSHPARLQ